MRLLVRESFGSDSCTGKTLQHMVFLTGEKKAKCTALSKSNLALHYPVLQVVVSGAVEDEHDVMRYVIVRSTCHQCDEL
jgi:hypothetical protein